MLNSKFFSKLIEEKKSKCANIHVGMIIKKKRKEMNLTLEEATKGICCVSYLSKLEHGIIEPKRYVMEEVLDRLEVNKTALRAVTDYDKMINDCISDLYYGERKNIEKIHESISTEEDIHFTDIIKAIYQYSNGNYEKSKQFLQKAFDVKEHLNDCEITSAILVSSLIRLNTYDYPEAVDQAMSLNDLYISHNNSNKLRLKIIIMGKFVLGEYSSLLHYINLYINICSNCADFDGIMLAKYYTCLSLAYSNETSECLKLLDDLNKSLSNEEYLRWKKDIYLALGKYIEALSLKNLSVIEKLVCYDRLGDKERIIKIFENNNIEEFNDLERKIYEALYKKHCLDEQFYILYLKDALYPYFTKRGFYEYSKYIKDVLLTYYITNNKYKDGLKIYKDFSSMNNLRWNK